MRDVGNDVERLVFGKGLSGNGAGLWVDAQKQDAPDRELRMPALQVKWPSIRHGIDFSSSSMLREARAVAKKHNLIAA